MRRSFFNGSSPLNFFNSHSSNKPPPPPPTSPPPKATPEHNKDNNTSPPATAPTTMMVAAAHCADAATQTAQKCQQQPHVLSSFRNNDKTAARDSSRSPLPTQVGQDYVSTIELSKKYGGGGDQRGWPLNSAAASCLDRK
uniref:Uncharacterized protein n=1 Tax=Globodera pallida TaxID=36090 RepID=A0A183CT22_GLOPA